MKKITSDGVTEKKNCKDDQSKKILKKMFVQQRRKYRRIKNCQRDTESIVRKIWRFIQQIFGINSSDSDCDFPNDGSPRDQRQSKGLLKILGQKSSHVPKDFFKIVPKSNMKPSSQGSDQQRSDTRRHSRERDLCQVFPYESKKFTCLCT